MCTIRTELLYQIIVKGNHLNIFFHIQYTPAYRNIFHAYIHVSWGDFSSGNIETICTVVTGFYKHSFKPNIGS